MRRHKPAYSHQHSGGMNFISLPAEFTDENMRPFSVQVLACSTIGHLAWGLCGGMRIFVKTPCSRSTAFALWRKFPTASLLTTPPSTSMVRSSYDGPALHQSSTAGGEPRRFRRLHPQFPELEQWRRDPDSLQVLLAAACAPRACGSTTRNRQCRTCGMMVNIIRN